MGKDNRITSEEKKNIINDYIDGLLCDDLIIKYTRCKSTIENILKNEGIYKTNTKKFTKKDLDKIIDDYLNGMCPKDLGIKYNRDDGTIIGKLKSIGIYKPTTHRWIEDEIEFLKIYYPTGNWELILRKFPNCTKQQIQTKMSKLGIKMDSFFWSDDDVTLLKNNYDICDSVQDLIEILGFKFTYKAITTKAKKIGLRVREFWTDDEIDIIKKYYSNKTLDEMQQLLPNRNRKTIISKASNLGITNVVKFSKKQEQFIIDNWKTMSDKEMADLINKTERGVKCKRLLLGLIKTKETSSYNDLSEYLRRNNLEWKNKSMISCHYKCCITGDRFDEIHHVYGLNLILNEVLNELNITVKQSMDDYSDIELRNILDLFRLKQDIYPLGICLRKDIHKLFHNLYGYGYNTPEQWYEFEMNFKNGEYNDLKIKSA